MRSENRVQSPGEVFVFIGLFFFFQAEDGIRAGHVTGVQTCALPIYNSSRFVLIVTLYNLNSRFASSLKFFSSTYRLALLEKASTSCFLINNLASAMDKPDRKSVV